MRMTTSGESHGRWRARHRPFRGWTWLLGAALAIGGCAPAVSTPTSVPTVWVPIPLNPASTPGTPTASPVPITPLPTLAPIAPLPDSDWSRGPAGASITLLLYSDFDCPTCAKLSVV